MDTLIDASNISPDILIWLVNSEKGHYIIRRPNKDHAKDDYFKVSEKIAKELMAMPVDQAWLAMETHCLNTGF